MHVLLAFPLSSLLLFIIGPPSPSPGSILEAFPLPSRNCRAHYQYQLYKKNGKSLGYSSILINNILFPFQQTNKPTLLPTSNTSYFF